MRNSLTALSCLFLAIAGPATAQSLAPEPRPPAGAAANLVLPPVGADGSYATPNRGLSPAEATWHLRAALNVAALNCRDADEGLTVANYNRLLAANRVALAAATDAVDTRYRASFGAAWVDARETAMTRVYNFFAQPPAHDAFCVAAKQVLTEAQSVEPADLAAFAVARLADLERPFTDFYARYDQYRTALAAWRTGAGGGVAVATLAAVSVTGAPLAAETGPH
ncbi:hypothetical protein [uncultured Sphingomonas sp.]|uniref:hypothetical protein n=1 Tax=uncultured Sphingomonas sp. TaxID=158754 RepID=UPI0035C9B95A